MLSTPPVPFVIAQVGISPEVHLAILIAGPLIPVFLWLTGVIRPAALARPGGSMAKHAAAVWILCGLALWSASQVAGTLAASMPAEWLGPTDQPRARAVVSLVMYALSVPTAIALLMALGHAGWSGGPPDLRMRLRDAPKGLLALLISAPVLYAGAFAAVWVATKINGSAPDVIAHTALKTIIDGARDGNPWAWVLIVCVTVGAPIVEESIYRGLVQTGLRRAVGAPYPAILLASGVFTAVHIGAVPPHGLAVIAVLSVALGVAYERTGSLIVPIVMHAGFNAANIVLATMAA